MLVKNNLIGQKFGKLTVIDEAPLEFKIKKRSTWKCLCDCGKMIYLPSNRLTVAKQSSCGNSCVDKKIPQENLIGRKFGKLIVMAQELGEHRKRSFTWKCLCECGNTTFLTTNTLKSGHTKSCGCGAIENKINICKQYRDKKTKTRQDPRIKLAKWIFNKNYADGDLSFEEFYDLSQQNCYYCDCYPSNDMKFSSKKYTEEYREASRFIYNGLDRINSNPGHYKNNVVPCCSKCNMAKRHYAFDIFVSIFKDIHRLNVNGRKTLDMPDNILVKQVLIDKDIFTKNKSKYHPNKTIVLSPIGRILEKRFHGRASKVKKLRYNDGDLTFDQFAYLSLQACYYCGNAHSNKITYQNISLKINGVDRLDSNKPHDLDNCVSCCKYCNYAKRTMSVQEFIEWSSKVYLNLRSKNIINLHPA